MPREEHSDLFRKKTMERISSPEQLSDYLRVTGPGVWMILGAVVLFLAGLFAWAAVGTLETTTPVRVVVEDHTAQIIPAGSREIESGMLLRVANHESVIASATQDSYGRTVALAEVTLPDGTYNAKVVTEQTRPMDFLFRSGS